MHPAESERVRRKRRRMSLLHLSAFSHTSRTGPVLGPVREVPVRDQTWDEKEQRTTGLGIVMLGGTRMGKNIIINCGKISYEVTC